MKPAIRSTVSSLSASSVDGLRAFSANYMEFTSQLATWLGLHSTDATALLEIFYAEDKGEPLSRSRLARRLGLAPAPQRIC